MATVSGPDVTVLYLPDSLVWGYESSFFLMNSSILLLNIETRLEIIIGPKL